MKIVNIPLLRYLLIAISVYFLGYVYFLNRSTYEEVYLIGFALVYFIMLPLLYGMLVMESFKKDWYKILAVLFLSIYAAKISFPSDYISFFQELSFLKIIVITVIVIVNARIIKKTLINMRSAIKSCGDPRVGVAVRNADAVGQQAKIEMVFASELVNWYYVFGKFRKNFHFGVCLKSGNKLLSIITLFVVAALSCVCFLLLKSYDVIVASLATLFILYSIPMIVANYRVSKYASAYIDGNNLILNDAIWAITVINIKNIKSFELGDINSSNDSNVLNLGSGKFKNIRIVLNETVIYNGFLGQSPRLVGEIRVNAWNTKEFLGKITEKTEKDLIKI